MIRAGSVAGAHSRTCIGNPNNDLLLARRSSAPRATPTQFRPDWFRAVACGVQECVCSATTRLEGMTTVERQDGRGRTRRAALTAHHGVRGGEPFVTRFVPRFVGREAARSVADLPVSDRAPCSATRRRVRSRRLSRVYDLPSRPAWHSSRCSTPHAPAGKRRSPCHSRRRSPGAPFGSTKTYYVYDFGNDCLAAKTSRIGSASQDYALRSAMLSITRQSVRSSLPRTSRAAGALGVVVGLERQTKHCRNQPRAAGAPYRVSRLQRYAPVRRRARGSASWRMMKHRDDALTLGRPLRRDVRGRSHSKRTSDF
jgi:hypothetical protein